jgi:hypothetical protein
MYGNPDRHITQHLLELLDVSTKDRRLFEQSKEGQMAALNATPTSTEELLLAPDVEEVSPTRAPNASVGLLIRPPRDVSESRVVGNTPKNRSFDGIREKLVTRRTCLIGWKLWAKAQLVHNPQPPASPIRSRLTLTLNLTLTLTLIQILTLTPNPSNRRRARCLSESDDEQHLHQHRALPSSDSRRPATSHAASTKVSFADERIHGYKASQKEEENRKPLRPQMSNSRPSNNPNCIELRHDIKSHVPAHTSKKERGERRITLVEKTAALSKDSKVTMFIFILVELNLLPIV